MTDKVMLGAWEIHFESFISCLLIIWISYNNNNDGDRGGGDDDDDDGNDEYDCDSFVILAISVLSINF